MDPVDVNLGRTVNQTGLSSGTPLRFQSTKAGIGDADPQEPPVDRFHFLATWVVRHVKPKPGGLLFP